MRAIHLGYLIYSPTILFSYQGHDPDPFHLEWDDYIAREFREDGRRRREELPDPDGAAVDVVEVIREAMGVSDNIGLDAADAADQRERTPTPDRYVPDDINMGPTEEHEADDCSNDMQDDRVQLGVDLSDLEDLD